MAGTLYCKVGDDDLCLLFLSEAQPAVLLPIFSLTVVTGEIWPQCTEISGWQAGREGEGERERERGRAR